MKGLLLKDFYNLRQTGKQSLLMLGFVVVWGIFLKNATVISVASILYCAMLVLTVMSYDEAGHFDKYALTLPVKRSDLVNCKYVDLFLLILTGTVVGLFFSGIFFVATGGAGMSFSEQLLSVLTVTDMYLISFGVLIPIVFRFGVERSRIMMAAVYLLIFGGMFGGAKLLAEFGFSFSGAAICGVIAAATAVTLLVLFVSWRISLHIVSGKEW